MSDQVMTPNENLTYQLETLASYTPEDLDNPVFDVAYEYAGGGEGFAEICCIDVASRALDRISELEKELKKTKTTANKLIDAANNEIARLETQLANH